MGTRFAVTLRNGAFDATNAQKNELAAPPLSSLGGEVRKHSPCEVDSGFEHMLCKNRPKRKEKFGILRKFSHVENTIFFPSHDVLQTHRIFDGQNFSTFFDLHKTGFEQSNFARIFNLIAFLRRSKTISSEGLPRNCRMTANSSLQMAKKRKNHRFAVKPPKTALRAPSSRRVLSH